VGMIHFLIVARVGRPRRKRDRTSCYPWSYGMPPKVRAVEERSAGDFERHRVVFDSFTRRLQCAEQFCMSGQDTGLSREVWLQTPVTPHMCAAKHNAVCAREHV
jgi:hypothetical protein